MFKTFSRQQIVDGCCVIALIAVFLVIALPRYRAGIDWGDEGFLAYSAVRVMEGQMPNRDFVSLQPPLPFYVVAIAFKLLGTSLASLRLLGIAVFVLLTLSVYAIARMITSPLAALAAALPASLLGIIFNFVPFSVWQGVLFSLIAVALYLGALFKRRPWLGLLAGIFTVASVLSRHDQGLYLIISVGFLTFLLSRVKDQNAYDFKRTFVFWLLGAIIPGLFVILFWWTHGALSEVWRQLVVFPLGTYRNTSASPFPRFDRQFAVSRNAVAILFFFPMVAGAAMAIALIRLVLLRRFGMREALFGFLLVWSGLFFCQALTRSDVNHLWITLPPFFILIAYCVTILLGRLPVLAKYSAGVSATVLFFSLVALAGSSVVSNRAMEPIDLPRGGIRAEQGRFAADFAREIQDLVPPDRPILSLPYQPMFYFLAERRNPTRWNYLWQGDQTAAEHELLIEQAMRDKPAIVLLTGESDMQKYAPLIVEFVQREYVKTGQQARVSIYTERPGN